MYRWIRNTHLFAGGFLALFLIAYGASAAQLAHPNWFPTRPQVTRKSVPAPVAGVGAEQFAETLVRGGILGAGAVRVISETPDSFAVRVARAGVVQDIRYRAGKPRAQVRISTASGLGRLNALHLSAGFGGSTTVLDVWGFAVALASVGLMLLAATGIYLWFRIYRERLIGSILLAGGLVFGITLIVLMRFS